MKIVKRGKPPEEKIWVGTCYRCKSVIEAQEKELRITYEQREGTSATAICPVCKHIMSFT